MRRCREAGINVPIIPGIKPIVFANQLTVLPRVFRSDLPEDLADAILKCHNDEEVHGVDALHFYTFMASDSVRRIAEAIY